MNSVVYIKLFFHASGKPKFRWQTRQVFAPCRFVILQWYLPPYRAANPNKNTDGIGPDTITSEFSKRLFNTHLGL
jgi:hypothetical protein